VVPRRQDVDDGTVEPRTFVSRHTVQAAVITLGFGAGTVMSGAATVMSGDRTAVVSLACFGVLTVLGAAAWRRPAALALDAEGWTSYSPVTGTLHGRWEVCGPFRVHRGQVLCPTGRLEPPRDRRSRLHRWWRRHDVAVPHGDDSFNGGPAELGAVPLARMLNRYRDHYGRTEDVVPPPGAADR